jgi:hypothetical protein
MMTRVGGRMSSGRDSIGVSTKNRLVTHVLLDE